MRLKLDENLSRHLKPVLEVLRHNATTAAEEGLLSRPDEDIAAAARAEGRLLLTLDLDFADIRTYPPSDYRGIVVLRPRSASAGEVLRLMERLAEAVRREPLEGRLWIVDEQHIRIRGEAS